MNFSITQAITDEDWKKQLITINLLGVLMDQNTATFIIGLL
jgi:hypothetical protein